MHEQPHTSPAKRTSPCPEDTASPAPSHPPAAGRISHACRPCNRSKVKCDGSHPCARCVTTVKAGLIDAGGQDEEGWKSAALELCFYQPSMRGRTKKRRRRAAEGSREDDGDEHGDGGYPRVPWISGGSRPLTPGTAGAPIPSLQVAFSRDSGRREDRHTVERQEDTEQATAREDVVNMSRTYQDHLRPGFTDAATPHQNSQPNADHTIHLAPMADRAKLTSFPFPGDETNPLGVLAEASAALEREPLGPVGIAGGAGEGGAREGSRERERRGASFPPHPDLPEHPTTRDPAAAADAYYSRPKQASPRTLQGEAPHIMALLTQSDAQDLFALYWRWFHPHLPVLDKEHSDPVDVASRSNYLFNAICCCAARSFVPSLWNRLKEFAKAEMTRIPLEKTLDVVQAHLLYCEWNLIPAKRFEQDLTYLRAGLAIRTAIDINLHRVALFPDAKTALPPWLLRSMIRTWLLTTVTDRTLSAQLGKPSAMRPGGGEDSVQRYLALLYGYIEESKKGNDHQAVLDDLAVALWAEWTQILNRALDTFRNRAMSERSPLGIGVDCYPDLVAIYEKQFQEWAERGETLISSVDAPDTKKLIRIGRVRLYHFYAELIIASFGLNQALERESEGLVSAFVHFQTMAIRLIECFERDLQSKGLIKGCVDFVFTALTYAVVSLLKSTQARYSHLPGSPTDQILLLCRRAADMLAKGAGASDHLPSLQATFLTRLLDIRTASSYTPKAIGPPKPVDLQAFAQSFEHRKHETNWPPGPLAGMINPASVGEQSLPGSSTTLVGVPYGVLEENHISTSHPTVGVETPFDLNSYLGLSNNALGPGQSGAPSTADLFNDGNARNPSTVDPFPDVPVASLGLTMGNFMNDQGVMDVLFANDGLWKSILESFPSTDKL